MAFGDVDELLVVVDVESRFQAPSVLDWDIVGEREGPGKGWKQPQASLVECKTGEDTDARQG